MHRLSMPDFLAILHFKSVIEYLILTYMLRITTRAYEK